MHSISYLGFHIAGITCLSALITAYIRAEQTITHVDVDDGDLQSGTVPPVSRFTDNGNGTITENLTGFLWTKDTGCLEDTRWEETLETASTISDGDRDQENRWLEVKVLLENGFYC